MQDINVWVGRRCIFTGHTPEGTIHTCWKALPPWAAALRQALRSRANPFPPHSQRRYGRANHVRIDRGDPFLSAPGDPLNTYRYRLKRDALLRTEVFCGGGVRVDQVEVMVGVVCPEVPRGLVKAGAPRRGCAVGYAVSRLTLSQRFGFYL